MRYKFVSSVHPADKEFRKPRFLAGIPVSEENSCQSVGRPWPSMRFETELLTMLWPDLLFGAVTSNLSTEEHVLVSIPVPIYLPVF